LAPPARLLIARAYGVGHWRAWRPAQRWRSQCHAPSPRPPDAAVRWRDPAQAGRASAARHQARPELAPPPPRPLVCPAPREKDPVVCLRRLAASRPLASRLSLAVSLPFSLAAARPGSHACLRTCPCAGNRTSSGERRRAMTNVWAIANQKGEVGKSTCFFTITRPITTFLPRRRPVWLACVPADLSVCRKQGKQRRKKESDDERMGDR